jgi:hypothetical protein
MALSRFVVTAPVTVPAGTVSAVAQPGSTVSWQGSAGNLTNWSSGMNPGALPDAYDAQGNATFVQGQVIMFDPATTAGAALQAAIGASNLRAYVQGQDDVGHAALANLARCMARRHARPLSGVNGACRTCGQVCARLLADCAGGLEYLARLGADSGYPQA